MASRIAPGQNPTGGDHNSHGNDSFSPDKRVLIRFCQQRQQLTHFFSLFTYKCIGTCRALNTNNYIVFELFTYACHLMHASYTKRRKKNNSSKISWHVGPCMPVSLTKISSWQRARMAIHLTAPGIKAWRCLVSRFHHPFILLRLELLQHAKDHVHTWGMALPTSLETDPCDV